jgi:hypothetical protein
VHSHSPNPEFISNSQMSGEGNDGTHAEIFVPVLGDLGRCAGGIMITLPTTYVEGLQQCK